MDTITVDGHRYFRELIFYLHGLVAYIRHQRMTGGHDEAAGFSFISAA